MSKNITMAVAVDRETEEKLVAYAKQSGVSVSKVIRDAIEKWIEEKATA